MEYANRSNDKEALLELMKRERNRARTVHPHDIKTGPEGTIGMQDEEDIIDPNDPASVMRHNIGSNFMPMELPVTATARPNRNILMGGAYAGQFPQIYNYLRTPQNPRPTENTTPNQIYDELQNRLDMSRTPEEQRMLEDYMGYFETYKSKDIVMHMISKKEKEKHGFGGGE